MQEKINQMAASMETMQKQHEEELNALRFYQGDEYNAMAYDKEEDGAEAGRKSSTMAPLLAKTRAEKPKRSDEPVMVTEVRIGDTTFSALIDTGCSRSAIEQSVVDCVHEHLALRKEEATFKQADKSTGRTTHVATAAINLPIFSTTRICPHDFRVAAQLLYPVMLGKDFFAMQGIDLLFSSRELEWDGLRVPMSKLRAPGWKPGLRPHEDDESSRVEISVSEDSGPVDFSMMIDGSKLSENELLLVIALMKEFDDVASGKLGKIKGDPYELPLAPDAKPFTCRPFPVPQIRLAATKNEI
ncbi:hypothetical protein PHMEG_00036696 [Phytophthora megakarya]|uniref:Uncharacterized protein n=1 Tax=Phytophthora megakarya TaxID=4795 RepID=A0A225UNT9_9STRA|nr:hypothetical protein PHMEG_00036696 [Phytophthora megakarya]